MPQSGRRMVGFISFPRILVLCEMQSTSSRIWTRVTVSISYYDSHYTTSIDKWLQYDGQIGDISPLLKRTPTHPKRRNKGKKGTSLLFKEQKQKKKSSLFKGQRQKGVSSLFKDRDERWWNGFGEFHMILGCLKHTRPDSRETIIHRFLTYLLIKTGEEWRVRR